jgi:hypothetical protein
LGRRSTNCRKQKKTQQFFCDEKPCCFIREFRRRLKFTSSFVNKFKQVGNIFNMFKLTARQDGQARLPGKTAGQVPGKTARQDCRARLPGKTAGQDCRARLPGKTARQDCRARLLDKTAEQDCRARLPATLPGKTVMHKWSALILGFIKNIFLNRQK